MALVEWNDGFLSGVEEMDRQHRHLVEILNHLHETTKTGGRTRELVRIAQDLVNYTRYHFATEERLMQESCYPGYLEHVCRHRAFAARVNEFDLQAIGGRAANVVALAQFLKDWLTEHTLGTDKVLGAYLSKRAAA